MTMTKGMKSTEFWMSSLGMIAGIVLAYHGASDTVVLALIGGGPLYGLGRGIAKNGSNR